MFFLTLRMVERKESSGGGSRTSCPAAGIAARTPNSAARLLPIDRVTVRKCNDNKFVLLGRVRCCIPLQLSNLQAPQPRLWLLGLGVVHRIIWRYWRSHNPQS